LIGSGTDHNDRELPATRTRLLWYSLVHRQQYVETGSFRNSQQIAVLFAFEACPLGGLRIVAWKPVPEIEWQALIQQNLHAILASNESFASSSA
jgi:hypothetical protein